MQQVSELVTKAIQFKILHRYTVVEPSFVHMGEVVGQGFEVSLVHVALLIYEVHPF